LIQLGVGAQLRAQFYAKSGREVGEHTFMVGTDVNVT
jgi:hypothetical protein